MKIPKVKSFLKEKNIFISLSPARYFFNTIFILIFISITENLFFGEISYQKAIHKISIYSKFV